MELIYSASGQNKERYDYCQEDYPICSLSSRNVVALASASLSKRTQDPVENVYSIHVCDIDKPCDLYHVTSCGDRIVAFEWHVSGSMLLFATSAAECQVWQMKDHMVNSWQCIQKTQLKGEHVVTLSWLHLGTKVSFNTDRKDNALYSDKVTRSSFMPSLSHFGGKPTDGWLAVTGTGLVCVVLLAGSADKMAATVHSGIFGKTREHISVADVTHEPGGGVVVVTSDGRLTSPIRCHRVLLRANADGGLVISSSVMASFRPQVDPPLRDGYVTHLRHLAVAGSDGAVILACGGSAGGGRVELWSSSMQQISIHPAFRRPTSGGGGCMRNVWRHLASVSHGSIPTALAVPRFPVIGATPILQYVAIGYRDGTVKLVERATLQTMTTTNLDVDGASGSGAPVAHMVHLRQALTGCVLVGVDQHACLYVMRVANTRDPVTQVAPAFLVGMLEYLMLSGHDWWDVLAAIRPGVMESVMQRLSDNFAKQTPVTRQQLMSRYLAVKMSIYRSCAGAHQRAADCYAHALIHAISVHFHSLLRPKVIASQDKSPAEKLTLAANTNSETDIDKICSTLERRDYVVGSALVRPLHALVEWPIRLTVYLLSCVPLGYSSFAGASLLHDASFLCSLRELGLIARLWGSGLEPACVPAFASGECLAIAFRLLTRVWIAGRDSGATYEDGLLDECCMLASQIPVPTADTVFGDALHADTVLLHAQPAQLTFGQEDHGAGDVSGIRIRRDVVSRVILGVSPCKADTQWCCRCGGVALRLNGNVSAWQRRWARGCLCGGHWKCGNTN